MVSTLDQRIERSRFILCLKIKDHLIVISLNESWVYLHRTRDFVRTFPGDKIPVPISARLRS